MLILRMCLAVRFLDGECFCSYNLRTCRVLRAICVPQAPSMRIACVCCHASHSVVYAACAAGVCRGRV